MAFLQVFEIGPHVFLEATVWQVNICPHVPLNCLSCGRLFFFNLFWNKAYRRVVQQYEDFPHIIHSAFHYGSLFHNHNAFMKTKKLTLVLLLLTNLLTSFGFHQLFLCLFLFLLFTVVLILLQGSNPGSHIAFFVIAPYPLQFLSLLSFKTLTFLKSTWQGFLKNILNLGLSGAFS